MVVGYENWRGNSSLLDQALLSGRFSGPAWYSSKQPDAVDWGRGPESEMRNLRGELILSAAGRI